MASSKKTFIGIDIGGSKIEGIFWKAGKIIRVLKITTPREKDKFLRRLLDLITRLSAQENYQGIGLGVPGLINFKTGLILDCVHLPFLNNFNLVKYLKKKLGKPVRSENDTKCFLLAEMKFGYARGKSNVVALTLGTGLGGAVLAEAQVLHGAHYAAQLTGMILSRDKTKPLNFQDLASSHGFKRLGVSDPLEYQNRAFAGDKKAIKIYDQVGKHLGAGCYNIAKIFDPELIVIGGGLARAGRLLMVPAKKEMKRLGKNLRLEISKLNSPGALGAVSLFLN